MRIFVPASASSDSSYLLYKTLVDYPNDEVITRISFIEAQDIEVEWKRHVCEWMYSNVRKFDYGVSEYDICFEQGMEKLPLNDTPTRLHKTILSLADRFECDEIHWGWNTHNRPHSSWFYQSDNISIDDFHLNGSKYQQFPSSHTMLVGRKIHWPLMHDKSNRDSALGRWQIWEALPDELKDIVWTGCATKCGRCWGCLTHKWYRYYKDRGMTAKDMDDLIMKRGEFGKYWHDDSKHENFKRAYLDMFSDSEILGTRQVEGYSWQLSGKLPTK